MEKNNERMSRPYVAPETEIVKIGGEYFIMQTGIEEGSAASSEGF